MAKKKLFDHPTGIEREYTRLLLSYSKALQADVELLLIPQLDEITAQFQIEMHRDSWSDTLSGIMGALDVRAAKMANVVTQKLPGVYAALSAKNEQQFKLVVKANTGLELPPVMPGAPSGSALGVSVFRSEPYLEPLARGWVNENVSLIKSIPARMNPEIEGIVRRGVMNGVSVNDLKKDIRARYGVSDYRAKLIAQDQINKGYADLTRYRLESVGVKEYIWRSVQDSRVRPEHQEYNSNQYSWEKPPPDGNPGQPVRCRCRAEAVWEEQGAPAMTAEEAAAAATKKATIFDEADRAWAKLQNTTDVKQVLSMRKQLMEQLLQQYGIPKTTSSVTLGEWQKLRLAGSAAPPVRPPAPANVTTPAKTRSSPVAARSKPQAKKKPDPFTQFTGSQKEVTDPRVYNQDQRDWNRTAWADAPDIIRKALYNVVGNCRVLSESSDKAWCNWYRREILMGTKYRRGHERGNSVWRHEYGHFMDGEVNKLARDMGDARATMSPHASYSNEWISAAKKDGAELRKSKEAVLTIEQMDARRARRADFEKLDQPGQERWLVTRYNSLGMDYKEIRNMYMHDGFGSLAGNSNAQAQNLFDMAEAIDARKVEQFFDALMGGTSYSRGRTLDVTGGGNFSDLIGSLTRGDVAGHNTGFGHARSYYAKRESNANAEVYANYFALYGTKAAPGWAQIFKVFSPNTDKLFRESVEWAASV